MNSKFGIVSRYLAIGIKKPNYRSKFVGYVTGYKQKLKAIELPERLKGTFIDKWFSYWRDVFRDYYEVIRDVYKDIRSSPWKGVSLVTVSTSGTYFLATNPDEDSFRDTVISYSNELIFVGPTIRNPEAVEHLKFLEQCYNEDIIRRFSFGVFSIIWVDNYNTNLGIFKAVCPYLKPEYLKFHERIIDVGFLNKWWLIDRKMLDIDVNPNEWNSR